jgi:hypothetical protein
MGQGFPATLFLHALHDIGEQVFGTLQERIQGTKMPKRRFSQSNLLQKVQGIPFAIGRQERSTCFPDLGSISKELHQIQMRFNCGNVGEWGS